MKKVIAIMFPTVMVLAPTMAQQKHSTPQSEAKKEKRAPVLFHGIALGTALESQKDRIPPCTGREFELPDMKDCYHAAEVDASDTADDVQIINLKQRRSETETSLEIMFDDKTGDATVEGVILLEDTSNTEMDLRALREKYGTPSCNDENWRTGIGIHISQLICDWPMPWGNIRLQSSVKSDINMLRVEATTNRLLKYREEKSVKDRKAAKDKF